jgi:hypothetical protein
MTNGLEIKNAVIREVAITNDAHGALSAYVSLDYGGACQSFGGYALYWPEWFRRGDGQKNYAGHFLWRVMEVVGVSEWSKLVGKAVRVKANYSKVKALGNIIREDWFDPESEFDAVK